MTHLLKNNPQILLWAVSCRNYFLTYRNCFLTYIKQGLWIILCNRVMISEKRHYCWVFQMYFCGTVSTTFRAPISPIILERRQKFLQTALQVRKTCIFVALWEQFKHHYIREKAEISTANISKTTQLSKLSRLISSKKKKRFWF